VPLIQIDLDRSLYNELHEEIGREIHQAQIDAWNITPTDRFQVFRPHEPGELKFDPTYGGVDRQSLLLIRITMVHKYSVVMKRSLYKHIVERLSALGIRPEDIQIAILENGFEDWYAGKL
jgi:hypothetical protein